VLGVPTDRTMTKKKESAKEGKIIMNRNYNCIPQKSVTFAVANKEFNDRR